MQRALLLMSFVLASFVGATAQAQVQVTKFYQGGGSSTEPFAAGTTIQIFVDVGLQTVWIRADNNTINIGVLTISDDELPFSSQHVTFIISDELDGGTDPPATGNNWAGLEDLRPDHSETLIAHIGGDLTQNIIGIEQINVFIADGTITSSIRADNSIGIVRGGHILLDVVDPSGHIRELLSNVVDGRMIKRRPCA